MIFSMEKSRVVWKSSSLAMLFHGFSSDFDTKENLNVTSLDEMNDAAKGIRVRLAHDDGGRLMLT